MAGYCAEQETDSGIDLNSDFEIQSLVEPGSHRSKYAQRLAQGCEAFIRARESQAETGRDTRRPDYSFQHDSPALLSSFLGIEQFSHLLQNELNSITRVGQLIQLTALQIETFNLKQNKLAHLDFG